MTQDSGTTWRLAAAGALLAVMVTAAYLPLRHNGFVNFDDDLLIVDNPALRDLSPGSLRGILERQLFTPHYKPLVNLSWAAELRLFGPDPRAFHRHNLMLHLFNALLALLLVALLSPEELGWRRRVVWAGAVATIWALHPMKVESVAWATERKDVLFAAFYLAAMLSYLLWVDRRRRRWLALSAVLALGGMLSKSTAITLPLALLLVDLLRRRRWGHGLLVDKLPHLAVTALALYLYGLLPGPGPAGGALPLIAAEDPLRRLAAAGHRHLAFAGHWLAPTDLAVLYPVPEALRHPEWPRIAAYAAAHLALAAGLLAALRRSPLAATALLFYSLTLLPTLVAPISITNYLCDRYTYLPSLGLAALVVLAAAALARRLPRAAAAAATMGVLLLAVLAILTYRQVHVWRDSERLWDHTLAVQGPHAYAYNNRGLARRTRGDLVGALADFDRALMARPRYTAALANRGELLRRAGRADEALLDIDRALAIEPRNPALYRARGRTRAELGRLEPAIADYTRALAIDPADLEALFLRAQAHRRAGHLTAARTDIERVLHAPRLTADHHLFRSLIGAREGDLEEAVADTTRALALDPNNAVALNNRGFLRLRLADPQGALADLERALSLRPDYPLANRTRGDALAALGRTKAACAAWRAAARSGAPATDRRLIDCPGGGDTPADNPP